MTKFHTDGENLLTTDSFDGTELQPTGRIVPPTQETKYPTGRAIAAAYWISYFALHWLTILEIVERSVAMSGTTIYFLAAAILATMLVAAHDQEKNK